MKSETYNIDDTVVRKGIMRVRMCVCVCVNRVEGGGVERCTQQEGERRYRV